MKKQQHHLLVATATIPLVVLVIEVTMIAVLDSQKEMEIFIDLTADPLATLKELIDTSETKMSFVRETRPGIRTDREMEAEMGAETRIGSEVAETLIDGTEISTDPGEATVEATEVVIEGQDAEGVDSSGRTSVVVVMIVVAMIDLTVDAVALLVVAMIETATVMALATDLVMDLAIHLAIPGPMMHPRKTKHLPLLQPQLAVKR